MNISSSIPLDAFTEKLLAIMAALLEKGALIRKKDFTEALGLTLSNFYQIEKRYRNFPLDEEKRSKARYNLSDKYFVNPLYLTGSSKAMFFKEPAKGTRITGTGKVLKITSAREVTEYKQKIEEYEARIAELEGLLSQVAEDPAAYVDKIKKTLKKSTKK